MMQDKPTEEDIETTKRVLHHLRYYRAKCGAMQHILDAAQHVVRDFDYNQYSPESGKK